MQLMYYIGLDVSQADHQFCMKEGSGKLHSEGKIPATRFDRSWLKTLPQPWSTAMEAMNVLRLDLRSLKPYAAALTIASTPTRFATSNPDINEGLRPLLQLCRETVVRLSELESAWCDPCNATNFWRNGQNGS